jgi:hypothetical protein
MKINRDLLLIKINKRMRMSDLEGGRRGKSLITGRD